MSKTNFKDCVWIERYRPQELEDYICTPSFQKRIDDWISGKNNSHLFFESGMGGTGKTTLAKLIAKKVSSSILFINASMDSGIGVVRDRVANFVSKRSIDGRVKVVIFDEIDYMTGACIASLRGLIDSHVGNVRYIATCNDWTMSKADPKTRNAFKQRFSFVNFGNVHGTDPEDRKYIAMESYNLAIKILEENNVNYDKEAVAYIVKHNFANSLPIRAVIQTLQDFSHVGITVDNIIDNLNLDLSNILRKVHKKDIKPVRDFLHKNENRSVAIINELEQNIDKYFDKNNENCVNIFFILRECLDRLKDCDITVIPMVCMFLEIGAEDIISKDIINGQT